MTKNNSSPTPPLSSQRIAIEEITDPDEIRAVEELAGRGKRLRRVLGLCQTLPEQERLLLLPRLASLVADEDQIEFIGDLLKLVPPNVVETIETELLARQEKAAAVPPSESQG